MWPTNKDNDLIEALLEKRNVKNKQIFFNPSLADLNDPKNLHGAIDAAHLILDYIKQKKRIWIHGDFDVDGVTATTILWNYLYKDLNANALPYIPDRFNEGYGLSDDSIQAIIKKGADVIITVDCGVKDIEIIEKYKEQVDFIITDHHTLLSRETDSNLDGVIEVDNFLISEYAKAVVHPRINNSSFHEICGAFVVWKLVQVINEFSDIKTNVNKYMDLVALGTVCDMMPLVEDNRIIVSEGLKQMKQTHNIGLKSLFESAGVDLKDLETYHLGYIVGPRINAAGRLEKAIEAVKLLSTNDKTSSIKLSEKLQELNNKRRVLTEDYYQQALKLIEKEENEKIHIVVGDGWPEGIVGLIAGKLTNQLNKPVLVATKNNEIVKGSARSVDGIHIANILKQMDNHLIRHGGHEGAAGFSLHYSTLKNFRNEILTYAQKNISAEQLIPSITIDIESAINDFDAHFFDQINKFKPFGIGNNEPLIGIRNVRLTKKKFVGQSLNHAKLSFADEHNNTIQTILFNVNSDVKDLINSSDYTTLFNIAGNIIENTWKGVKSYECRLKAIQVSTS